MSIVERLRLALSTGLQAPPCLLTEAADRIEALERLLHASEKLGPWIAASVDAPDAGAAYVADASAFLEVLAKVDVP